MCEELICVYDCFTQISYRIRETLALDIRVFQLRIFDHCGDLQIWAEKKNPISSLCSIKLSNPNYKSTSVNT